MEMGIDEGGRHQPAAQIDLPRRLGLEGWLDALGNNPHIAIAAGLGILVSSALGAGLMALIFYSNRSGADEAAAQSQRDDRRDQG